MNALASKLEEGESEREEVWEIDALRYFRLMPRDQAKLIFEIMLSRKRFFKNLDFSKMWDPGIWWK